MSTWAPTDLTAYLNGTYTPPTPTLMPRTDGACLLYPGLIHSLHGESESGKSWLAQYAAAAAIHNDQDVLYIDYESDPGAIANRFRLLGCTDEMILRHLDYVRPETAPAANIDDDFADLLRSTYAICIIDGVTDAMSTAGLSIKDNDDVARWMRHLPRQVADHTGAAARTASR